MNLQHGAAELSAFKSVLEQQGFRKELIVNELRSAGISLSSIEVVVGRGGLIKPISGGVYKINEALIYDLKRELMGSHASNLGGLLACGIAADIGPKIEAYIVDPVIVDELDDIARISGFPEISRKSIFHALNHKAVARRYARERWKRYEDLNLIVVHIGGGITIGAHKKGRVVDVNNGLDGEGPFSPERSGSLPVGDLAKLCYSGKYTYEQVQKKITGEGGLVAYLGTNSAYEAANRARSGDEKALFIYRAMAYQVAKDIGAMAAVLEGNVDAIILTGGIAYDGDFCKWIEERVGFISKVIIYPGEDEMKALAEGVYYAVKGEIEIKEYIG